MLLAVLALEAVVFAAPPSIRIRALRSEYLENPVGIEERKPRLSWKLDSTGRGAIIAIPAMHDAMAEADRSDRPYQTRLGSPPADPRVAHPGVRIRAA